VSVVGAFCGCVVCTLLLRYCFVNVHVYFMYVFCLCALKQSKVAVKTFTVKCYKIFLMKKQIVELKFEIHEMDSLK